MLVFFPTPYPDELLYSVCARYRKRTGDPSPKNLLQDLFGKNNVLASVDLPSHIGALVARLPVGSKITAERLIMDHTMYPFYSAFLPPRQAKSVLEAMVSGSGKRIYAQAGVMASSIRNSPTFRYCPLCFREDLERHGELYWHRMHHIPGWDICVKHGTWLNHSKVALRQTNKHVFAEPTEENCPLDQVAFITDSELLSHYRSIGNGIEALLTQRFPHRPLDWFQRHYESRLRQKHYASPVSGKVDQAKLQRDFIQYYGNEFLGRLQSSLRGEFHWLAAMVRKHRKSFFSLRHLLLMNFLGISLEEMFEQDEQYKPFGDGPWLCLNPAAEHYQQKVITDLTISTCEITKEVIGTFACSCGFVYTRRAGESDQNKKSRVKQYGEVWEQACLRLANESLSLREIGRRLHADPMTVKNHIRGKEVKDGRRNSQRERDRTEWLSLQQQHPNLSKTELRKLNSALYARLYRNDRIWLDKHSPKPSKKKTRNNRVDWNQRDLEVLAKVQDAVSQILESNGKPKRLTVGRIAAIAGVRALLERHLDRLPETKKYLEKTVESEKQYRWRKIQWAMAELKRQDEPLQEWKVLRIAGIRKEHAPMEFFRKRDSIFVEMLKEI
ncbi:TnsD family Tn7-like transposition protein [Brevibacillus massiliensis]|uniref:TnsD family Tn7-like transposition protein n=1 Tax=Brevibacillus massiliensis TaxID=1118054 RepID=UPI00031A2375|nr:TnsD family Tn7-like transposition protein [Brevibacillus massiliensis]